jgi:hypothetical protein
MDNNRGNLDLTEEFRRYEDERVDLRKLIGKTKALGDNRIHRVVNYLLFIAAGLLFVVQLTVRPFEGTLSLEIGIFLVSIKLILMIDSAARFNHFQFWILHSIEQRMNRIAERLDEMDKGRS